MCVNSFSSVVQGVIGTRQQIRFEHMSVFVKQEIITVGVARVDWMVNLESVYIQ